MLAPQRNVRRRAMQRQVVGAAALLEGAGEEQARAVAAFGHADGLHRLASRFGLDADDLVVLLLAASGGTPYTVAAAQTARTAGALTVGFANNPGAPLLAACEFGVLLDTGPEVISGSTRLQAGTVCDTCCETAWDVTVGPVGGADPESVVHSDLKAGDGVDISGDIFDDDYGFARCQFNAPTNDEVFSIFGSLSKNRSYLLLRIMLF